MSPKELRQLVSRLEAEAASRPWLYKLRLVGLALLGYGSVSSKNAKRRFFAGPSL